MTYSEIYKYCSTCEEIVEVSSKTEYHTVEVCNHLEEMPVGVEVCSKCGEDTLYEFTDYQCNGCDRECKTNFDECDFAVDIKPCKCIRIYCHFCI